jgi:hypothetical protein
VEPAQRTEWSIRQVGDGERGIIVEVIRLDEALQQVPAHLELRIGTGSRVEGQCHCRGGGDSSGTGFMCRSVKLFGSTAAAPGLVLGSDGFLTPQAETFRMARQAFSFWVVSWQTICIQNARGLARTRAPFRVSPQSHSMEGSIRDPAGYLQHLAPSLVSSLLRPTDPRRYLQPPLESPRQ